MRDPLASVAEEDPNSEFVGSNVHAPDPAGPRIINVGIHGPGPALLEMGAVVVQCLFALGSSVLQCLQTDVTVHTNLLLWPCCFSPSQELDSSHSEISQGFSALARTACKRRAGRSNVAKSVAR